MFVARLVNDVRIVVVVVVCLIPMSAISNAVNAINERIVANIKPAIHHGEQ